MEMKEPEEQRLEDEPMEPAEDIIEPSDEPVLSASDASEPDDAPASVISPEDKAVETPVDEEAGAEPSSETPLLDSVSAEEKLESMPASGEDQSAWFVIHCYSGYENKVRHNLEQRIETMGMKDMIFDVVVPTQEEIEVRDGKRRTVERHIFPGYVLVNMILTEESWYVVRNTPGVTGFVGMGNNPTPLRPEEVAQIVKRMEADAPTVKVTFKVGERVRIIDGPFNDFRGMVAEIDMERTKVRVMVSFFGRETPVELDFLQVEKA
jgi:transcriptional antiterminator NusG